MLVKRASDIAEVISILSHCIVRSWLVAQLQEAVNARAPQDINAFMLCVSERQARHVAGTPIFRMGPRLRKQGTHSNEARTQNTVCYSCGEQGHMATQCPKRSREPNCTVYWGNTTSQRVVKCFKCGEVGHKSPKCPK